MSSHLHLLCKGTEGFILSDIMRDFKKFTSKQIVKTIKTSQKVEENGCWNIFKNLVSISRKNKNIKFGKAVIMPKLLKVIGL